MNALLYSSKIFQHCEKTVNSLPDSIFLKTLSLLLNSFLPEMFLRGFSDTCLRIHLEPEPEILQDLSCKALRDLDPYLDFFFPERIR